MRRLAASLGLIGVLAIAAVVRTAPPAPRGADAPASEFSAVRALAIVRELGGDGPPRPAGSPADGRAADAIAARLRALGLETAVQDTFACGVYGVCAPVRNVVARLGPSGGKAVVLSAHHDSVPAGPGASDDLSGVAAVLEVARALAAGPPLARPFIALVTDAEESGLIGASAFAEAHPWRGEVGAVVNLEARGTTGPSIMFDTSGSPAWVARVLRRMPHPVTTSLASAVYHLIPNDTDLTTFERYGMPGLNLAFAFGVTRYHTPLDDIAHLDPRSLQHQGENALALVRAISVEDLEAPRAEEMVFFDVLGLGVVGYRRPLLVAAVAALAVALAAWRLLARAPRPMRSLLAGVAAAVGAPAAAAVPMLVVFVALRTGALPRPFVASPGPFAAAGWASGAGGVLLASAALGRRAGAAGLFAGAAVLQAILGLALAVALPGASHVVALPALVAGLAGLGWARSSAGRAGWAIAAALAPTAVGALVLFPIAYLLPHALGVGAAIAVAAFVALAVLPLAPLCADLGDGSRFRPAGAAFGVTFALAALQAGLPHATPQSPERVTIAFHEDGGLARWLVETEHDELPASLREAAPFSAQREKPFEWAPLRPSFVAAAAPLALPAPTLTVISMRTDADVRRIRARLASPRGAPQLFLLFPRSAEILSFTMAGVAVPAPTAKSSRWWGGFRLYACGALPAEGVEIDVALRGPERVPVILVDESRGLPPDGARLARARPPSAAPSQEGDSTLVTARATL